MYGFIPWLQVLYESDFVYILCLEDYKLIYTLYLKSGNFTEVFTSGDSFTARNSFYAQISNVDGMLYIVGGKGATESINYNDVWSFSPYCK